MNHIKIKSLKSELLRYAKDFYNDNIDIDYAHIYLDDIRDILCDLEKEYKINPAKKIIKNYFSLICYKNLFRIFYTV